MPPHVACGDGHAEVAAALIDAKADVNARDNDGETPLLRACSAGSVAAVEALLAAGADAKATNHNGRSALHLCAGRGTAAHHDIIRLIQQRD